MKNRVNFKKAFILACILIVVIVSFYQTIINIDSGRIEDMIKTLDKVEALNSKLFDELGYTTPIY